MANEEFGDWLPWFIVGGILIAIFFSKSLSPNANTTPNFAGNAPQRGTFGTDTGLYGSTVADGVVSA